MTEVDVRPQRAHHSLGGARVLAIELRGEPCPTFRRRAPRHGCQPCLRGSRLTSRAPSALSPSSPALAAHTLDQDSPAYGNMSRAGDDCGVVVLKRRWHDHRPASQTGQGGACSCSARNRRSALPRPEQLRVEVCGCTLEYSHTPCWRHKHNHDGTCSAPGGGGRRP